MRDIPWGNLVLITGNVLAPGMLMPKIFWLTGFMLGEMTM